MISDVPQVHSRILVEVDVGPAADLPQAGETGKHGQTAQVSGSIAGHLAHWVRARTDERHVAQKHVEKLGKLVDARSTQESPHARHTSVVSLVSDRAVNFVPDKDLDRLCVRQHGPKLIHPEAAAAITDAFLPKDGSAARGYHEQQENRHKHRQEHSDREYSNEDIDHSLAENVTARAVACRLDEQFSLPELMVNEEGTAMREFTSSRMQARRDPQDMRADT